MVDDITKWLEELGLGKYTDLFVEHEIDAEILADLTEADLKDLGIPLGSRKKLLKAIAALGQGAGLSSGASAEMISPHTTDTSILAGERRQVTVLFADLSGYTKLSATIDAEEAHALLSHFFDRADGIIRDYGGTVDKHIGDSVMAVFGAPLAHDNDPERAVRAADAIQQAMPDLASKLGRPLKVHIGVASGQVVASGIGGDTHYTVIGDSVNLAARLTDAAGPGEILITAAVERATTEIVDVEDHGEITVKGLSDPVRVSKVSRIRAASDRRDVRPLIDRHAEVRQFSGALYACLETGVGQVIYLRGEAGIGKTRLLEEFRHLAVDRGFACHRALILDFGVGKGQDPVRTLVRSLLGIPPTSSEAARSAAAEQAAAHGLIDPDRTV
ncbi:MAG: adenylate/guanylate cyclase domain-containing protein, partial [Rubricoccaceae bacterium]|nr:adenylate/guanylate cyclase domain-containing protein [Rubricoccaceae bacterium]